MTQSLNICVQHQRQMKNIKYISSDYYWEEALENDVLLEAKSRGESNNKLIKIDRWEDCVEVNTLRNGIESNETRHDTCFCFAPFLRVGSKKLIEIN